MPLDTNLAISPYFDDYSEQKNFSQVLFKPAVPIQARELTQLQDILQNQITRFGDNIFDTGTVIKGCNFITDSSYTYIKLPDLLLNGQPTQPSLFVGTTVVDATSNLQATVINSLPGYVSQNPNLNTLYIKYMNTGANNKQTFLPSDVLTVYNTSNSVVSNLAVTVAPSTVNGVNTNPVGSGYAFRVSDGIIYQKGYFIRVGNTSTAIISPYTSPNNVVVGFSTQENIVTYLQDDSLLDNAAGYSNLNAPGADRMQLIPTLVVANASSIPSNNFFTLAQWQNGNIIRSNQQTEYSNLGRELARRSYETNGNYVVNPFAFSTETIVGNTSYLNLVASQGLAYVDGYRVQLQNNIRIPVREGSDTKTLTGMSFLTGYGNYVVCQEMVGSFPSNIGATVSLRDTAGQALTGMVYNPAASGNEIGQGKIVGVQYLSGTPGTNSAQYAIYLNSIVMNSSKNFSNVRSIYYANTISGQADTVLTSNAATLTQSTLSSLVFDTTKKAVKTLRNGSNNDTQYIFRTINSGAKFANTGVLNSITLTGSQQFPYGTGSLNFSSAGGIIVVPQSNATVTLSYPGTATGSNTTTAVTGTNTAFLSSYQTYDYLLINGQPPRQIVSIANNTSLNVNSPYTGANVPANTHSKCYIQNVPIPFVNRLNSIVLANTTSMTMNLIAANGTPETLNSNLNVTIHYNVQINSATQLGKTVQKNVVVNIDTASNTVGAGILTSNSSNTTVSGNGTLFSTYVSPGYLLYAANGTSIGTVSSVTNATALTLTGNAAVSVAGGSYLYTAPGSSGTTGPWCLGIPDVYQITGVYRTTGNTFSNTGTNVTSQFALDTGQRDGIYTLSNMIRAPGSTFSPSPGDKLTVVLNAFKESGSGYGFFTVDSYPVDDANTANTTAIQTTGIPTYTSSNGTAFNLRNSVDFRPVVSNTAVYASNTTAATINPSSTAAYSGGELYLPAVTQPFLYDIDYYLGRIDSLVLSPTGVFLEDEGTPSEHPVAPSTQSGSMTLGIINVPPYPSLSAVAANTANSPGQQVTITTTENQRYTMKDIGALDKRITNLEYYSSLSLLENATSAQIIKSSITGAAVFQNGIFVDPYTDTSLMNTSDPEFSIAIDPVESSLIPRFQQNIFKLKNTSSSNAEKTGDLATLSYTSTPLLTVTTATGYRNVTENLWSWNGTGYSFPTYDAYFAVTGDPPVAIQTVPDVITPPVSPPPAPATPPSTISGQLLATVFDTSGYGLPLPLPSNMSPPQVGQIFVTAADYPFNFYSGSADDSLINSQYATNLSGSFMIEFTGYITFPESGSWTISAYHDDGGLCTINGTEIWNGSGDSWTTNSITNGPFTGTFTAVAGTQYSFELDYYQGNGPYGMNSFNWTSPSGVYNGNIPMSAFASVNVSLPPISPPEQQPQIFDPFDFF